MQVSLEVPSRTNSFVVSFLDPLNANESEKLTSRWRIPQSKVQGHKKQIVRAEVRSVQVMRDYVALLSRVQSRSNRLRSCITSWMHAGVPLGCMQSKDESAIAQQTIFCSATVYSSVIEDLYR